MLISPRRGLRVLAAAALLGAMALPSAQQSWAGGTRWTVTRSGPCTVRSHGQLIAAEVLRTCRLAVPQVARFRSTGWSRRVLVVVPADAAELTALAPEAGDLTDVAGVATRDRVLINPTAWASLSSAGKQVVLTHEVTHLALRALTTSRTPLWLVEGVADHVGLSNAGLPPAQAAQELAADVRRGLLPRTLPTDEAFTATPAQAYEQAWLAVDLLAHRYGDQWVLALYAAVGRDGDLDAALQRLGTNRSALVAAWRADLVRRLT